MSQGDSGPTLEALSEALDADAWTERAEALHTLVHLLASDRLDTQAQSLLFERLVDLAVDRKWEIRKATAAVLGGLGQVSEERVDNALSALVRDSNRWVRQAAERARSARKQGAGRSEWAPTAGSEDPTLQFIARRIRQVGRRRLTPAQVLALATEVGEQFYREFAVDTAHEFRTLLTPVEGYIVELRRHLQARGKSDPTADRYLDLFGQRLEQIQTLLDQIQIYSSPAGATYTLLRLTALVTEAVTVAAGAYSAAEGAETAETVVDVDEDIRVEGIGERLTRAIANVVLNAYQATPPEGTLRVTGRLVNGNEVELEIADTGHGMAPEIAEHALERFRTTRRASGGTGLGLPIARRIIEHDHQGVLTLQATKGEGTTVVIRLPRQQPAKES